VYRDKNPAIATSAGPAERSGSAAGVVNRLSLSELIHRVVAQNRQIQIQQAEWAIKQAEEKGTHAIFEPDFVTTAEYEDNSKKNTPQESLNRPGENVYTERNWYYRVGLKGLVPTGGKVNLGYELRQLSNTVTKDLTDEEDEHEMYLGLNSVTGLGKWRRRKFLKQWQTCHLARRCRVKPNMSIGRRLIG
jgi:hypothetical protein